MSWSKWRWTEACDHRPCVGDCDLCDYDEEETYTIYAESGTVSVGGEEWKETKQ